VIENDESALPTGWSREDVYAEFVEEYADITRLTGISRGNMVYIFQIFHTARFNP
jgi:hypothetical protein